MSVTPSASASSKNSLSSRSAGTVISLGAMVWRIGSVVSSSIDFANRVLVEIALLVVDAEDLERAFALRCLGDRRAGEADDRGVRHRRHQVGAEILGDRPMRLVDEDVDVVAGVRVLIDPLELVDHRQDQTALVGLEQVLDLRLGVRPPDRDVLLLHLAEQLLDPALELPFELGAVDDEDDGRVLEALLVFEDQPRGGQQGEGLARALRVPDEPALLCRVLAARDDLVDGDTLVLAQHRFPRFAVLDVEQDPVLQRAQEVGRLEEGLDRELVGFVGLLLPARHERDGEAFQVTPYQ